MKKTKNIIFRLSPEEYKNLRDKAKAMKTTVSDLLREVATTTKKHGVKTLVLSAILLGSLIYHSNAQMSSALLSNPCQIVNIRTAASSALRGEEKIVLGGNVTHYGGRIENHVWTQGGDYTMRYAKSRHIKYQYTAKPTIAETIATVQIHDVTGIVSLGFDLLAYTAHLQAERA